MEEYSSSDAPIHDEAEAPAEQAGPTYDGVSIYEFDIDGMVEKPWRQARSLEVLSQYFNYGFDEATWRLYCWQRKQRAEKKDGGA